MFERLKQKLKKMLIAQIVLFYVFPLLAVLFIWMHYIEPNRIKVRREQLTGEQLGCPVGKPVRILHLSDLHLGSEESLMRMQDAIEKGLKMRPDIVLISGDTCCPIDAKLAAMCEGCLASLSAVLPVYACLGNHDYVCLRSVPDPSVKRLLKRAGIVLLENEKRALIVNGQKITVVGLTDVWKTGFNPEICLTHERDESAGLVLLMAHNPDTIPKVENYYWTMMLSGHTHGGQFRFPFTSWCPMAPVIYQRYAAKGLHHTSNGRWMNLSAGIGNYLEMRLNCFPEVVVIDLLP